MSNIQRISYTTREDSISAQCDTRVQSAFRFTHDVHHLSLFNIWWVTRINDTSYVKWKAILLSSAELGYLGLVPSFGKFYILDKSGNQRIWLGNLVTYSTGKI